MAMSTFRAFALGLAASLLSAVTAAHALPAADEQTSAGTAQLGSFEASATAEKSASHGCQSETCIAMVNHVLMPAASLPMATFRLPNPFGLPRLRTGLEIDLPTRYKASSTNSHPGLEPLLKTPAAHANRTAGLGQTKLLPNHRGTGKAYKANAATTPFAEAIPDVSSDLNFRTTSLDRTKLFVSYIEPIAGAAGLLALFAITRVRV